MEVAEFMNGWRFGGVASVYRRSGRERRRRNSGMTAKLRLGTLNDLEVGRGRKSWGNGKEGEGRGGSPNKGRRCEWRKMKNNEAEDSSGLLLVWASQLVSSRRRGA